MIKKMKEKRLRKMETIKNDFLTEDCVKIYGDLDSKNLVISFGSTKGVILEAIDGLPVKFLQIQVLKPFPIKIVKDILRGITNIISAIRGESNYFKEGEIPEIEEILKEKV
jgi:2-oxoglutarate ferredoxin oxidoreductase subunit alpha